MDVAIEEMGHLALVNNFLVAVGGAACFESNFPVASGYHPANITIRLTPLTHQTLQHFIYLERPSDIEMTEPRNSSRNVFILVSLPDMASHPRLPIMRLSASFIRLSGIWLSICRKTWRPTFRRPGWEGADYPRNRKAVRARRRDRSYFRSKRN